MRCPKYQRIGGRTFWGTPSDCMVSLVVKGAHLYISIFVFLTRKPVGWR